MAYILLKAGELYGAQGYQHKEYLIQSAEDLADLPTSDAAPGSIAHTPGYAEMYELGFTGNWVKVGGTSSVG